MNRICILLVALFSCGVSDTEVDNSQSQEIDTSWQYSESKDDLDNSITYFAELTSAQEIEFDFPYDGVSTLTLVIRKKGGEEDVMLSVSKGQFVLSLENEIRVKFDNTPPDIFSYSSSSSGDVDVIFLSPESDFIEKIKTAKKIIIEPEFYQHGKVQVEFIVEGLKW